MRERLLLLASASRGGEPAEALQLPHEAGEADPETDTNGGDNRGGGSGSSSDGGSGGSGDSGSSREQQPVAGGLAAAAGNDPKGQQFVQSTLTEEGEAEEYGEDTSDEDPDSVDSKIADAGQGGGQQQQQQQPQQDGEEVRSAGIAPPELHTAMLTGVAARSG